MFISRGSLAESCCLKTSIADVTSATISAMERLGASTRLFSSHSGSSCSAVAGSVDGMLIDYLPRATIMITAMAIRLLAAPAPPTLSRCSFYNSGKTTTRLTIGSGGRVASTASIAHTGYRRRRDHHPGT